MSEAVMVDTKRAPRGTHHSVSHRVAVGPQLGVDVRQEPAEGSAPESRPQVLPLGNVPDVDPRLLGRKQTNRSSLTC